MTYLRILIFAIVFIQCTKDENPEIKVKMEWVFVKGGTFEMGSRPGEADEIEMPAHEVTLSDYYIGKYEVTNLQFAQFLNTYKSDTIKNGKHMGETICYTHKWGLVKTDSGWYPVKGYENHPAINITWEGASEFCSYFGWRLPTEAEWEYASLGGNMSKGYIYSGSDSALEVGWCSPDYEDMPGLHSQPVGIKKPNELEIYDMCGNAWEWVWDYKAKYKNEAQINPKGPDAGTYHIMRGGCWLSIQYNSRTKTRSSTEMDYHGITHNGFRCAK